MSANAKSNKTNVAKLVIMAMLSAVAAALQYLEFAVPFVPPFLKLDFSDIPELIGAFVLGPAAGVLICLVKNLLHCAVSMSFGIGELSNFILGAVFAFTAGIIYKYKKTRSGALLACIAGTLAMTGISVVTNYFIVYPVYAQMFGGMENIMNAYKAILPTTDSLIKALVIFNVPFTFVKGAIDVAVTMLIYKPLSKMFTRMNNSFAKRKSA